MSVRLLVNADDYGHTPGVSAGIRDAHLKGIVTSTTAMMNMPGVDNALRAAMETCPRLGLGVHLVLTTGLPLLAETRANSLIAGNRGFLDDSTLVSRLPRLDSALVRAEWHAQVAKFVAVTGHAPDHLDAHHHVSYLSSDLFQIMLELARDFGCAIRLPIGAAAADILGDFSPAYSQACLEKNSTLMSQFQTPHPDYFIRSFYDENATAAVLQSLLEGLAEGTTEIMCHPGYFDGALMKDSDYQSQREVELAILTSPEIVEYVQAHNIELINFAALQNRGPEERGLGSQARKPGFPPRAEGLT